MSVSAGQGVHPTITVLHGDDQPQLSGLEHVRLAHDAATLAAALPGTEVLLVWDFLSDAVHDAWPAADAGLRWVHTASAGVDRLSFPGLAGSAVTVTNSRGVFDTPIAEYVLGLVLAMAKDLPTTLALQARREWRHRDAEQVAGATAVVVGGGPIGRAVARLLRAVGMHVELVGRAAAPGRHGFDELPVLLPRAGWLVLAAPLTEQTRGMVDAAALAALPAGARVINVARGALVDEAALVAAVRLGRLGGAALDVVATEPLLPSSPLWELPGVIISPHMSGDTHGWRAALVDAFIANLDRYRAGQPLHNVVDKRLGYVTDGPDGSI
ncbi:D-2-hydroxyacid dehydrogenase [Pseudonocardia sp. GCM10023141]|uniref:D-2-hydroxyacid dehydrogenase n=1 Tax=Pseudonocardia sp. GCM10023141 TaxID=3252653 RepID=UPI003617F962